MSNEDSEDIEYHEEAIEVTFRTTVSTTWMPFRYKVGLLVDDIDTGIVLTVWFFRRADEVSKVLLNNANDIIHEVPGLAEQVGILLEAANKGKEVDAQAKLVADRLSQLKPGDRVRLLKDLGPSFPRGRSVKVARVTGDMAYPITVVAIGDSSDMGIPLSVGEYGPIEMELDPDEE